MRVTAVTLLICVTLAADHDPQVEKQSSPARLAPERSIAITFDDLPLNGPPLDLPRLQTMTTRLLAVVTRHTVPVIGFVNESQLYVAGEIDARISVLKQWTDAGAELGNHTFSHPSFRRTPLAAYQDDVIRGDTVTTRLMKHQPERVRYFRHPFLHMGETREVEEAFERFLGERNYRIAPVTVDPLDWLVLNAYNRARVTGSREALKRVITGYLKLAADRLAFSEQMATEIFGRPIRHILLLHANELNADALEELLMQMKNRGYRFITLQEALTDDAYRYPDHYTGTSHWLALWAASKGLTFNPPEPPDFLR